MAINEVPYIYIVTCRGDYRWSFELDDWIYSTLYIHTTWDYRQYNTIADLPTLQFTVTHTLGFSVFTSHILAMDLSQSHRNFKSHMKSLHRLIPFLPLFCSSQFWRHDLIQFLCYQAHILAGWRPETRLFTLCCSIEFFFITNFHGPHGKHHILLSRIVLGVFTAPLHSNGCGTGHTENSLSIAEACLLRAHVYRVIA
jgi:hypothetical protein